MDDYISVKDAYMRLIKRAEIDNQSRAIRRAAKIILELPLADVRENARGEWLCDEPRIRTYGRPRSTCGRCGAFALYEFVNVGSYNEKKSNYCPNCGADLRGDAKWKTQNDAVES